MYKKYFTISIMIILLFATTIIMPCNNIVSASNTTSLEYETDNISARSTIKKWYYKEENGKLYKRLYNTKTKKWETNWIFVKNL